MDQRFDSTAFSEKKFDPKFDPIINGADIDLGWSDPLMTRSGLIYFIFIFIFVFILCKKIFPISSINN